MLNYMLEPVQIGTVADIERIRIRAYERQCDELLGCAKLCSLAASEGILTLPTEAAFPDPPDVLVCCDRRVLAMEVTRITWTRQSQVIAEAEKLSTESLIGLDPSLWVDRHARRDKKAPKGQRNGDYQSIRLKGERLISSGWTGDAHVSATLSALAVAVERKKARLSHYLAAADAAWLFLIDDGVPGAWDKLLCDAELASKATELCTGTGFERTYLFQFSDEKIVALAR
jgi:hypothetical protein